MAKQSPEMTDGAWVGGITLGIRYLVVDPCQFGTVGRNGSLIVDGEAGEITNLTVEGSRIQFSLTAPSRRTLSVVATVEDGVLSGTVESPRERGTIQLVRVAAINRGHFEPFSGTYRLSDGRVVFLGNYLGSNVLTLHDFRSGRIGAVYPSSATTAFIGPALGVPHPPTIRLAFALGVRPRTTRITWQQIGGEPVQGERVTLRGEEVSFSNGAVHLAGTLFLPPGEGTFQG